MFVEAFSPSHQIASWNALPTLSPIPCCLHRHRRRANSSMAAVTCESTSSNIIDYSEELQRHTVTVPSFDTENTDSYPSLLHKIYIQPLLSNEETTTLLNKARDYASENSSWDQQDSSRHVAYRTVDFAIEESIEISQYLGGIAFQDRIFGALSEVYDVDADDLSFLDLFIASYEGKDVEIDSEEQEERNTMDRLDFHRDGSLLSFTVLLSPPEDFEGGGTIFDALGDVAITPKEDDATTTILQSPGVIQPPQAGYATLHSGKLLHGGNQVTKGQRIVLVGFVDVDERNMKPGALGSATKEWGRNDVREFWNKRRLSLLKLQQEDDLNTNKEGMDQLQPVWKLKNWRYLPKQSSSYFGKDSTIPTSILKNMEKRASIDKIRKRRLITEDRLLREILLPREERGEKIDDDGEEGEWMEVDMDSLGMDGLMLGWDGDEEDE